MLRITFPLLEKIIEKETGRKVKIFNSFRTDIDKKSDSFTVIGESEDFDYSVWEGSEVPFYPFYKEGK